MIHLPVTMIHSQLFTSSAAEAARKKAIEFETDSRLVTFSHRASVPELPWDQVRIGSLLGKGGFNNVCTVHLQRPLSTDKQPQEYVIKSLRKCIMLRKDSFVAGAQDLVVECKMLTHLNHENIIRLHATGCVDSAFTDGKSFFLLLDRLYGTLEEQIRKWRWQDEHVVMPPGLYKRLQNKPSEAQKTRMYSRLYSVLLPIGRAMVYLHSNNIIYRDLKPGNVGFDAQGTVKLFDFGLSRELKPTDSPLLTANTGSPLYMSPEVALGEPYGLPADVFSFAILMWEVLTLSIPFNGMSAEDHYELVMLDNHRPKVDAKCGSKQLQQLVRMSWDADAAIRPTFAEIVQVLQEESQRKLPKTDSSVPTGFRSRSSHNREVGAAA